MIHDMAVQHPLAGIIRNEGNANRLARAHQHGVAPFVIWYGFPISADHMKAVTMQVHRVPPGRLVP